MMLENGTFEPNVINRYESGRNPLPVMLILDSKTIQNADTAEEKGYDEGKNFADAVKERISANVEIAKHSELHTFAVIPKDG